MKDILALIQQQKLIYAQSPLFQFMQDESIHPLKRLAFAPCAAPFIMSFADLCKYVLRQEPTNDQIQKILNQHTYEDDSHWQWFLEDLEKLGFNYSLQFNDSLRLLWSEETQASRFLTHEIYRYSVISEPLEKLVILEAMEAAADTFFAITKKVTNHLQITTGKEFKYFGNCHLNAEENHTAHCEQTSKFIENIYISEKSQQKSLDLVKKVFELFIQWNHDLLRYAQSYQVSQALNQQVNQKTTLKVESLIKR